MGCDCHYPLHSERMQTNNTVLLRVWDQTAIALAGYVGHANVRC